MDNRKLKELEANLWEAADDLRANSDLTSNEYCMPVLGLIFLRYAESRYEMARTEILKEHPVRPGRVFQIRPEHFQSKSALFLEQEARYSYLLNLPENVKSIGVKAKDGREITSLGGALDNAMSLLEAQSKQLEGVLPKSYYKFNDELLSALLRNFDNELLNDVGGDVLGRIYEYFLGKFAKAVAQDDGVFFTPKSLVRLIVNIIEPEKGILLDPACGSGGMFVQIGDFVNNKGMEANKKMTFYGQEKTEFNAKLCAMNMAVHGLNGNIASGEAANTFYHDAHELAGKCDYVMANPPFNVDKVKADDAQSAGRLPFGLPTVNKKKKEIGNANYLWISYFYAYLNERGRAGFVMAASATDGKEAEMRRKLVEAGAVDVMVSVGNNFFYTLTLPCSLWFFNKAKSEQTKDKVLFIDARNYYTVVDRNLNEWSDWQLRNLTAIVWLYRGEQEKYKELVADYRAALVEYALQAQSTKLAQLLTATEDLPALLESLAAFAKEVQEEGKQAVEKAKRNEKKQMRAYYDAEQAFIAEITTVVEAWQWLVEKFGTEGEYQDVAGLCRIADKEDIAEKGYSLTPGAYVGVAPVADDGVDFATRMREIHGELVSLQKESNELMERIAQDLEAMGL